MGAIISTLAVVLPPFIIILVITALLKNALKNQYVQAILRGLKPCMIGIILASGIYMVISNCLSHDIKINYQSLAITFVLINFLAINKLYKKQYSPIMLIVISAFLGIIVYEI